MKRLKNGVNYNYPIPYEGRMAKTYLAQLEEDAHALRTMLNDDDDMPGWVKAYVATSADRMNTASRYMQYEAKQGPRTQSNPRVKVGRMARTNGRIRIGDTLRVHGARDSKGASIPALTWTVVALDRIEGSGMYAALARGDWFGRAVWLAGRLDPVGRPGHPPEPMRGDNAVLWETEEVAREDHAERIAGNVSNPRRAGARFRSNSSVKVGASMASKNYNDTFKAALSRKAKDFDYTAFEQPILGGAHSYEIYEDVTFYEDDFDFSGEYVGSVYFMPATKTVKFSVGESGTAKLAGKQPIAEAEAVLEVVSALNAGYTFKDSIEEFGESKLTYVSSRLK